MISKTIGFRGLADFQTHPHVQRSSKRHAMPRLGGHLPGHASQVARAMAGLHGSGWGWDDPKNCWGLTMVFDTLWWTYKKLLKMAIEIVSFPINSMVDLSIAMLVHQRVILGVIELGLTMGFWSWTPIFFYCQWINWFLMVFDHSSREPIHWQ